MMKSVSILLACALSISMIGVPGTANAVEFNYAANESASDQFQFISQDSEYLELMDEIRQSGGFLEEENGSFVFTSSEGDVISLNQSGEFGFVIDIQQVGGREVDVDPIEYKSPSHADEVRYYIGRPEMRKLLRSDGGRIVSTAEKLLSTLGLGGKAISMGIKLVRLGIKAHNWRIKQWIKDTKNVRGIKVVTYVSGGGPYPRAGVSMHPLKCYIRKGCP